MTEQVEIQLEIHKWQDFDDKLYKLNIKVIGTNYIPYEIFVYRYDALQDIREFSYVATPVDLVKLPTYTPTAGNLFYRDNYMELHFNTAEEREVELNKILDAIRKLKNDWQLVKDDIDTTYEVII